MGKKLVYAATPSRENPALSNTELAVAGFVSAIPTTLVAAPVERIKVLLQVRPFACSPVCTSCADESRGSAHRCKGKEASSSTMAP